MSVDSKSCFVKFCAFSILLFAVVFLVFKFLSCGFAPVSCAREHKSIVLANGEYFYKMLLNIFHRLNIGCSSENSENCVVKNVSIKTGAGIARIIAAQEALYIFMAIVEAGNVSAAARVLDLDRHTVLKKFKFLRLALSDMLFVTQKGESKYEFTKRGESLYHEAKRFLRSSETSLNLVISPEKASLRVRRGFEYFYQRYPLWELERHHPLIQFAYVNWINAKGQYIKMREVAEWAIEYRQEEGGWRFLDIGRYAGYRSWMGEDWCNSARGRFSADDASGSELTINASVGYHDTMKWGHPIIEHVHTIMGRGEGKPPEPANIHRILLPCELPEGDKILLSVVAITNDIKIDIIGLRKLKSTPDYLLTDFPSAEVVAV